MTFVKSAPLLTRAEILARSNLIPQSRGAYAWFFRNPPPGVPTDGCYIRDELRLLYVGISPKNERSRQHLRKRVVYHLKGNAEGSTLRLTLGTLLAPISDYPLRRVGSGKRMTFTHQGEQWLDMWLNENALVCWTEHPEPWLLEHELLGAYSLPLNIQDNRSHPFCASLSEARRAANALQDADAAEWIMTRDGALVCSQADVDHEAVQRAIRCGGVPRSKRFST
jgi:hypothetical protein